MPNATAGPDRTRRAGKWILVLLALLLLGALGFLVESLVVESEAPHGAPSPRPSAHEPRALSAIDETPASIARSHADLSGSERPAQQRSARERAASEIASEKDRALADVRNQVAELALAAAARVVGETMTDQRERRLVEEFLGQMGTSQGGAKRDNAPRSN